MATSSRSSPTAAPSSRGPRTRRSPAASTPATSAHDSRPFGIGARRKHLSSPAGRVLQWSYRAAARCQRLGNFVLEEGIVATTGLGPSGQTGGEGLKKEGF